MAVGGLGSKFDPNTWREIHLLASGTVGEGVYFCDRELSICLPWEGKKPMPHIPEFEPETDQTNLRERRAELFSKLFVPLVNTAPARDPHSVAGTTVVKKKARKKKSASTTQLPVAEKMPRVNIQDAQSINENINSLYKKLAEEKGGNVAHRNLEVLKAHLQAGKALVEIDAYNAILHFMIAAGVPVASSHNPWGVNPRLPAKLADWVSMVSPVSGVIKQDSWKTLISLKDEAVAGLMKANAVHFHYVLKDETEKSEGDENPYRSRRVIRRFEELCKNLVRYSEKGIPSNKAIQNELKEHRQIYKDHHSKFTEKFISKEKLKTLDALLKKMN